MQKFKNQSGFSIVEIVLGVVILVAVASSAVYAMHRHHATPPKGDASTAKAPALSSAPEVPAPPKAHTGQEAVAFVQKAYDDYLTTLNQANSSSTHTQPVAQTALASVKDRMSSALYAKAAAVTQATPFSCTAQYVADAYTATLSSNDSVKAVVAVSISNGSGLHTDGMKVTVDLTSLQITDVTCPS